MVYRPRRVARRRVGAVRRMAKGKTSRVQVLAKAVRTLQRKVRTEVEYLNYSQNIDNNNISGVNVWNLSYYSSWARVFNTSTNDDSPNKMIHKSFGMDVRVSLENSANNEEETTNFTCYLVSFRDNVGGYFAPGTGTLTMVDGQTHSTQKGMVLLNKKIFNIHKMKRFTLTNYGTALTSPAAQSQYGTDRRWYWRIPVNKLITNPTGDWKVLNSAQDPSKTYFLIVFSDNSTADFESPVLNASIVHTVKTVA